MKVWFISDTHRKHGFLDIPFDVDMLVHSGDSSVSKVPSMNNNEVLDFLEWMDSLTHIKHKVFVPGNHDTSIEAGIIQRGDIPESITFLQHEYVEIEGLKIFGSPYTPAFGTGWAYNVPRDKMDAYWNDIPNDLDILITHGPPKGILDLTQYDSRAGANGQSYFQCGCAHLRERVQMAKPRYHVFGHIHPEENCLNSGILKVTGFETTFINAAVLGAGYNISNNGFILEI